MPSIRLVVRENDCVLHAGDLVGKLEIGRQRKDEPAPSDELRCPTVPASADGPARLIIAPTRENNVGRQHVLLEPLPGGTVRVRNGSQVPLAHDRGDIPAGEARDLTPPFTLAVSGRSVSVLPAGLDDSADEHGVKSLDDQTLGPGSLPELSARLKRPPALPPAQLDEMLGWLQTTIGVLQSAVGSTAFLQHAADALVQIVGLSSGRVLLFDVEPYSVVAAFPPQVSDRPWSPSQHVLGRVRAEKRTCWQHPRPAPDSESPSLHGLQTVVASPLLDRDGNVIGALYGERREEPSPLPRPPAGKLEATLVELLACGVSTGLARQQQEQAALAARVQFEQFFTPALARLLADEPDLVKKGADREVTLLFCDVRGFSGFSERLGAEKTVEWINDVMSTLSECVLNEEGVLVDYIGDEMLAMWGAPFPQPDQAERAARAALAMTASLPGLNERWRAVLGGDMGFGIGLNTGVARVGNTGSRFKFKYGPLGNTVNLASRVQGLTKYLKCRLLVTAATRVKLGEAFIARRVVRTRVVNIMEPVDLFEAESASTAARKEFFAGSEAALDALEGMQFAEAARRAGALLPDHPGDGPLQLVLSRASEMLMRNGAGFDPVWEPPGK